MRIFRPLKKNKERRAENTHIGVDRQRKAQGDERCKKWEINLYRNTDVVYRGRGVMYRSEEVICKNIDIIYKNVDVVYRNKECNVQKQGKGLREPRLVYFILFPHFRNRNRGLIFYFLPFSIPISKTHSNFYFHFKFHFKISKRNLPISRSKILPRNN